jgi:hypothetical protein
MPVSVLWGCWRRAVKVARPPKSKSEPTPHQAYHDEFANTHNLNNLSNDRQVQTINPLHSITDRPRLAVTRSRCAPRPQTRRSY